VSKFAWDSRGEVSGDLSSVPPRTIPGRTRRLHHEASVQYLQSDFAVDSAGRLKKAGGNHQAGL
jgi:hypothetical protein